MSLFVAAGTGSAGVGSCTPAHPAGLAAGDYELLLCTTKYPANGPATPAGWTKEYEAQGGAGASGVDAGSVLVTVFSRIATGSESGTVAVTATGSNVVLGRIYGYRKTDAAAAWAIGVVGGADNTGNSNWSVTASAAIDLTVGDIVVIYTGCNSDGPSFSVFAIAATGITFGAQAARGGNLITTGDDVQHICRDTTISAGTAVQAPVYTMTVSGAGVDSPAGVTAFIRLREVAAATGSAAGVATAAGAASSTAGATGVAAGVATGSGAASSTSTATGAGAGIATATGSAAAGSAAAGSAAGTSTAAGDASVEVEVAIGAAAGTSTASGDADADASMTGAAAGSSTAEATADAGADAIGLAAGAATAAGEAFAEADAIGAAAGTSTAWGFPPIRLIVSDGPAVDGRAAADPPVIEGRLVTAAVEIER